MRNLRVRPFLVCLICFAAIYSLRAEDRIEINPFAGGSFFRGQAFDQPNTIYPVHMKLINGGTVGVRVTENIWEHFSLEQGVSFYGVNNVRLRDVPGVSSGRVDFSNRLYQLSINVVGHMTPRDARVRPFITVGGTASMFRPTPQARAAAANPFIPLFGAAGPIALDKSIKGGMNYGVGLKAKLSSRVGVRFDARGLLSQTPFFGIPRFVPVGVNTISLPKNAYLNGLQLTGGISFYFGETTPPLTHEFTVPPAIEGAAPICPGEAVTLRLPARDSLPGSRIRYRWTVNGQDANNDSPEFRFTAPQNPGEYAIAAHVEVEPSTDKAEMKAYRKNPAQPADRTTSVRVKEYKNPTATCDVDRKELQRGETANARVTGTGSECGGQLSYRWTASEGTISGGTTARYDSTNVSFDQNITDREQSKNVTLTATVTDEKGGTANCAANLTVRYRATAPVRAAETPIRLDDIVFARGSARVNNCGKRILADELYPQMTRYRDYDIVLIGHTAANERPAPERRGRGARGRAAATTQLDRERVLNTAAFLSAGTETCKDIETARIKADWVGTDQTSEFRSRFCETSTREKKGQETRSNDPDAKNRRVEIWLVPKGAAMPSAVKAIKDIPADTVRAKGCPK